MFSSFLLHELDENRTKKTSIREIPL